MKFFLLLLTIFLHSSLYSNELEKVSLQLQWKHQFQFAGYYVAKEKGFYKDAGFNVDIKEFEFGLDIAKDIVRNKIDFGVGRSTLVINRTNGDKVTLLASIFQSSPHILLALKRSGIKTVQDFKGKRIMFTGNAKEDTTIVSMVFSKGLTLKDIIQQKHSFNVNDLINNKTDIMSSYISNEPYILKEKGFESVIFDPKDYGFDFYNDILFTSEENVNKNPKMVQKFKLASLKGWEYAFNNIEETVEIILQKYNTQNKSKNSLLYEAQELKKLAYYQTNTLGKIDKNKVERIYDFYKLMGHTSNKIDLDKFIFSKENNAFFHEEMFTKKELDWIEKHPSIKVANELDYPPFDFVIEDIPKGFSIDLLNLLSKYINIDMKYINGYTWNELQEMFKKGELDLLHSLTKTTQREKYGIFSDSFIRYKTYIFTTKQNEQIKNIEQLFGKTIVVGKGWSIESYLAKNYPQIKLLKVDNVQQMLLAVSKGDADALINDKYSTLYDIKKYEIDNIIQTGWFKEFDNNVFKSYHFLAQKDSPELVSILNKALAMIPKEKISELKLRWFNESTINSELDLTQLEKEYIENKKRVSMCVDPNWMPFEKIDKNGKHIGISSDYYKLLEKSLGLKFDLIETKTWAQTLQFAEDRTCDIISLAMKTPERKKYLNFTTPYLNFPLVVVTKLDIPFIDKITDLKNKTVAITKGYAFVELLKAKYPFLNIVEVENIDEGLKKVNNKQLDVFIGTFPSVGYSLQLGYQGELKIAGKLEDEWNLGTGIRNDDKILLNILNKAVSKLNYEQQQKILNKWISIKYENGVDYTLVWKIIGVFLIIMLIVLFYIRKLNILKSQLDKSHKTLQKLIDTQDNIVILTNGKNISFVNKSFFKFLGYQNLEQFKEKFNCIYEKFMENDQFFHIGKLKENENWIEHLLKLPHSKRIVGMLSHDFKIHAFSLSINKYDKEQYIISFANVTQTILCNIELQDKTTRDTLTNAFNREYLEQNINNIIKEAQNSHCLLGVAFLDIDFFKDVNDTYGHDVGDAVLIHFVDTLNKFSRDTDILIRWGGEEFILLLQVKTKTDLQKALEHLRKVIELETFPTIGQKTCSIGATIYNDKEDIIKDTIKRADIGVYEAKESGRNKVVLK